MKRILLLMAVVLLAVTSASAISPVYKGYGEFHSGYAVPSGEKYGGGIALGLSTSHGVTLFDGLFVGLGVDATLGYYTEPSGKYDTYTDYSGLFAIFTEGRYNILHAKRISPFVGLRLGGGFNGYGEVGAFYFSPAVGCTFNLTERFGLDVSMGYSLYTGKGDKDNSHYSSSYYSDAFGAVNCISFRVGVHF